MTHAVIFEKSDSHEIVGFQTEGHAGYADAGSDIVCAAISVLVINTINSVEQFTDSDCTVTQDEENAGIYFRVNSSKNPKELQVLLQSLVLGLSGVAEGNADYLSITFKEV